MAAPKKQDPVIAQERAEAWTGDAVLALYVREWILRKFGKMDGEMFVRFTSNDFLSCAGNPTSVEAQIGRIYATEGLQAGFDWIEKELYPKFLIAEKEHQRKQLTQVPRRLRKYGRK
ncbi:ribonuclease III domain-containing protein [Rubritalea sp.]|uniref:ribonuclease III domain-containing protein n=1 Tax=Rubritalea sp. TaxID=2109375 RepID=UPI003EF7CDEE